MNLIIWKQVSSKTFLITEVESHRMYNNTLMHSTNIYVLLLYIGGEMQRWTNSIFGIKEVKNYWILLVTFFLGKIIKKWHIKKVKFYELHNFPRWTFSQESYKLSDNV